MNYVIRVIYSVNTSTIKENTFRTKGRYSKAFFLLSPLLFFLLLQQETQILYCIFSTQKKYLIVNKLKILFLTKYTYHFL